MKIELYSRTTCKACSDAKRYLDERNVSYSVLEIGSDITRDALLEKYPLAKQLPVVVIDGEWVGSKEELMARLK